MAGAVFQLEWRANAAASWAAVDTPVTSSNVAGSVGLVTMPSLDMSIGGQFRLREIEPPPNYLPTPTDGYWLVNINPANNVISLAAQGDNPAFDTNAEGALFVGNAPAPTDVDVPFSFTKTNNISNPVSGGALAGAVFQLYWRADIETAWSAVGGPVTSGTNGVVNLMVSTAGQYRLVETIPPPDFAPLFGYWIIVVGPYGDDGFIVTAVNPHGDNPEFARSGDNRWWVGNRLDFELPLTGGTGLSNTALVVGAMAASVAILAVGFVAWDKTKSKKG